MLIWPYQRPEPLSKAGSPQETRRKELPAFSEAAANGSASKQQPARPPVVVGGSSANGAIAQTQRTTGSGFGTGEILITRIALGIRAYRQRTSIFVYGPTASILSTSGK